MSVSVPAMIFDYLRSKAVKTILTPVDQIIDQNITEISTTLGSYVIRKINGKIWRQIVFTTGINYSDEWMEEALYGIIMENNPEFVRNAGTIELSNKNGYTDGSAMMTMLADGAHNLKYRKWKIILVIATNRTPSASGRVRPIRTFCIRTTSMDNEFVQCLQRDLITHRNAALKINANYPKINVYKDFHESDGYTYWSKEPQVPKRSLSTIYLPREQKQKLVDTINRFFEDKALYNKRGIPWNLNILFYGESGGGKSSITKAIATEWNRNIYEINGGKNGKYIPDSIEVTENDAVHYPLFSIQDIDRYPHLVKEAELDINNKDDMSEERLRQKQVFRRFLNALDGVTGGEGKIVVMTANNIEGWSPVLLRPGRFDLIMHIGYIDEDIFAKYTYDVFGYEIPRPFYLKYNDLTIGYLDTDTLLARMPVEQFIDKYTTTAEVEKKSYKELIEPERLARWKDNNKEEKKKDKKEDKKKLAKDTKSIQENKKS